MAGEEAEGHSLLEHVPRGLRIESIGPAGQLVVEAASALAASRLGEWGYLWWRSRPLEAVFRRPRAVTVASD